MSTLYRTTLAMCCLASILPLGALAADAEKPSTTTEAPVAQAPRPPLLERSQEDAQALERLVPKAEQQTLQAGADSFLALWKPANDSDPQGAVIIVPGAGETADWPNAVGPLRQKFPDIGWHSLSISLPDLLADSPQARVEAKPAAEPQPDKGESAPAKDMPADANANVAQATAADADTAESTDAKQASEQTDPADAERQNEQADKEHGNGPAIFHLANAANNGGKRDNQRDQAGGHKRTPVNHNAHQHQNGDDNGHRQSTFHKPDLGKLQNIGLARQ